jgi:radical SAM superfamily enzyme
MNAARKRFSTATKLYAAGIAVALVLAVLRVYGLSVADAARIARSKFVEASADAKAIISGEYSNRYARKLREEAANIPVQAPRADGNEDPRLGPELAAERKRILEEYADYLQKQGAQILKGDTESLKKQVEESARRAGGNN